MTLRTALLALALTLPGCLTDAPQPKAPAGSEAADAKPLPDALRTPPSGEAGVTKDATASWAGTYTFEEFALPNQTWSYTLSLQPSGTGTLDVDGFQTLARYAVRAEEERGALGVRLAGYREGNRFEPFERGALLFILEPQPDGPLHTVWEALEPNVPGGGPVAFERTEDPSP